MKEITRKIKKWCKPGVILYLVRSMPSNDVFSIRKVKLTSGPYLNEGSSSCFCDVETYPYYGGVGRSSFSFLDFNIIPNDYNYHKIFINEKAANKYLKRQIKKWVKL